LQVRTTAAAPDPEHAAAAILIDARDGSVIAAKNPRRPRAMASTTKLMTALLALERAKPSDVYRAPPYDALPAESKINLRTGERMRVDDLLEALLLESANDAAETLAEGVAGSRARFVAAMNARARQLGLRDTSYANPIGLDDPRNRSSARDLATLARLLMRDERFAAIVRRESAVLESGAPGGASSTTATTSSGASRAWTGSRRVTRATRATSSSGRRRDDSERA
jgi:D-alanyl-D-alanine carboxypeptidase (penicillin-binding protein 5/6)